MKGIIMIGVSGSGKTTWANSNKQYEICSTDSIIEELANKMGTSYTQTFDYIQKKKKFDYISKEFFRKISRCILDETDFVIDRTHLKRNVRISLINELKTIANDYGKHLELSAVSFELSHTVIMARLRNREKNGQKVIPRRVIYDQINSFTAPTLDEGFDSLCILK